MSVLQLTKTLSNARISIDGTLSPMITSPVHLSLPAKTDEPIEQAPLNVRDPVNPQSANAV